MGRRHTMTAARDLMAAKKGLRVEPRFCYAQEMPYREVLQEYFEPRPRAYFPMLTYYEVIGTSRPKIPRAVNMETP